MAIERRLMTAEEFYTLPDDGTRMELVDGEVRKMVPPGSEHGRSSNLIGAHLLVYATSNPGVEVWGEAGFLIARNPDRVLAPDIAIIRTSRIPSSGVPKTFFPGPPDIAIEIVSPNDTANEILDKVRDWFDGGALQVWAFYPGPPRLVVHRPDGSSQTLERDDAIDGGDLLPGFRMKVADLLGPLKS